MGKLRLNSNVLYQRPRPLLQRARHALFAVQFLSKYNLYTCAAFENHSDYQEAEVRVVLSRAADADVWARPATYSAGNVPYRMKNYSTALKIELRNGQGPATSLPENLPAENNGTASLILHVKGKFYEQAYGLA